MTGLEKIIGEIHSKSQSEAQGILEKANSEAQELLQAAKSDSNTRCAEIEADTTKRANALVHSASSAADLECGRMLLRLKQEMLNDTLRQAMDKLLSLPDDEYFSLLIKMAAECADRTDGLLCLNQKDLDRRPSDFSERLNRELPKGASLSVSEQACQIEGGFILKYGAIEQNCSFYAVFDERREELTDQIRDILFPQE